MRFIKAKRSSLNGIHAANCQQKIEVCIACEKNSFLNPITCYCGTQLTPDIGSKWGALLVSGKDSKDGKISKALTKDVKEFEKLLTSQAPRIFGLRKDNVRTVVPRAPDNLCEEEHLWPKVKEHIETFSKKKDIDTLLIFFSCHGEENSHMFNLGVSDCLSKEEFQNLLECLCRIKTLIIILDRCFAPMVKFEDSKRIYLQINSCREHERATMTSKGSIFTKFLIRGLKAKSEGMICPKGCQSCLTYWENNRDFITFQSLVEFIKDHITQKQEVTCTSHLYDRHSNIAFYNSERVLIRFNSNIDKTSRSVNIPLDQMGDIDELKRMLKKRFEQEEKNVTICIHTPGRKQEPNEYCHNIEKLMLAWQLRQELDIIF